jgi:hypothetical protein
MTNYNEYVVEYTDKKGNHDTYTDKFVSDWSLEHNLTVIARDLYIEERTMVSIKAL